MNEDVKHEVEEIDLKIAELKKQRRELLAKLGEGRLSWGAIIAGAFGALMVGLGIIALFAANWDMFGREARAAIAVAPVVACGAVAIAASLKGVRARALWEPLGILWCVSVAAATCLVAQTYQVGGSVPGLVLLVALLMLPAIWTTRAVAPTVLWPILAIVWGGVSWDAGACKSFALAAKGVALMALSLPAYVAFLRSRPPKSALVSAQIVSGLVYSAGLGMLLCITLPLDWGWHDGFLGIMIFWLCAALVAGIGRFFRLPAWGAVALVVVAVAAIPTPLLRYNTGFIISLVLMASVVVYGVRKMRLLFTNVGAATFLWLVLAKFFGSEASFTVKGIVLIAAGLALTALNVVLIRLRKGRRA
ncbi:MAG: DUF2157 domain-containing protein [Kiritimatiellae bacterium]|nr:DUF2157 domain-containing protein [Kiritimatiellia bacterium]